ncbi:MAG: hypothetical protein FWF29_10290 [Treponema sp.]|nr:hypothetical protein [Treponema sp.]
MRIKWILIFLCASALMNCDTGMNKNLQNNRSLEEYRSDYELAIASYNRNYDNLRNDFVDRGLGSETDFDIGISTRTLPEYMKSNTGSLIKTNYQDEYDFLVISNAAQCQSILMFIELQFKNRIQTVTIDDNEYLLIDHLIEIGMEDPQVIIKLIDALEENPSNKFELKY